ncbi:MAG: PIN domain-containing protein [Anaerolineae bacterium]|nr:PIN domain-containing protein [Anaerolineae bacterium]
MAELRAVIDTNILFAGLTKQGGASGLISEAWLTDLFHPCVSNALAYEYTDVLSRKLSEKRWQDLKPVLGTLLSRAELTIVYFTWRPSSPDPADEHLIDCAMNAGAIIVTSNIKDFKNAQSSLGLNVMEPVDFIVELAK